MIFIAATGFVFLTKLKVDNTFFLSLCDTQNFTQMLEKLFLIKILTFIFLDLTNLLHTNFMHPEHTSLIFLQIKFKNT
jgi:hypothetical protein